VLCRGTPHRPDRVSERLQQDLMRVMLKCLTLTESTLRPRKPEFKAYLARELEQKSGRCSKLTLSSSFIDKVFPLTEADPHSLDSTVS
jgi:hypothetical protein